MWSYVLAGVLLVLEGMMAKILVRSGVRAVSLANLINEALLRELDLHLVQVGLLEDVVVRRGPTRRWLRLFHLLWAQG